MGLVGAIAQLLVAAIILLGGSLYTRHHVQHLQRADHSAAEYLEDSKAGNGTRYRVLERAAETDGASYTVEVLARGSAEGFMQDLAGSLPAHEHLDQEEELRVLEGKLGWVKGRTMREGGILAAGQTLVISKGTPHTLYNADNSTHVLYELTHRPAGPLGESFFENLAGLGWDYGSLDRIHPLQVLVLYDEAGATLRDLPSFLQPVVKKALVPMAKLLGFKAQYPTHRSGGTGSSTAAAAASAAQPLQQLDTDNKQEL